MKKIIKIDPDYDFLRQYIERVPVDFDSLGTVLQSNRNVIREDEAMGTRLVVKSYRRIYLPNRIRYTYLYPSKAQRAYDYANKLIEKGFRSPRPIAYIEIITGGLISDSYFICEHTDFIPFKYISELTAEGRRELLRDFTVFTHALHQSKIFHGDYSMGNILFKKINGKNEFSLIDNNRIHFGVISLEKGVRSLERLDLPLEELAWIGKEYSKLSDVEEIVGVERLFHYKRKRFRKDKLKRDTKKFFFNWKKTSRLLMMLKNACFIINVSLLSFTTEFLRF